MKIRTRALQARTFNGTLRYVWFQDMASGRAPHVYTVLALNSGDPVTIGRELPEYAVRTLIEEFEAAAKGIEAFSIIFTGQRSFVLRCRRDVSARKLVNALRELGDDA